MSFKHPQDAARDANVDAPGRVFFSKNAGPLYRDFDLSQGPPKPDIEAAIDSSLLFKKARVLEPILSKEQVRTLENRLNECSVEWATEVVERMKKSFNEMPPGACIFEFMAYIAGGVRLLP